MWDIGWRIIVVGLVFLLDFVFFAGLVWAEFVDVRARWAAIDRRPVLTVRDRGRTAASPAGVRT
jgi:hypothetical protein